ncbi:MAG: YbfB/YjiJ family MFS transporter [Methylophilaceae bacterium]|nr:YbfB/YjiJ family MFS transporter [Methylophilaceae bacterium]
MQNTLSKSARLKVLFAGISSLILSMGIARFAYTPLLPVMVSEAGLSPAGGAWLAAINYSGYLFGVILASRISHAGLKNQLYRWGMVLALLSTMLMAISTDFYIWAVSRFVAGLSTAAGLILGSGLILNWLMRNQYRSELGIHFSGIGFGIVISSFAAMLMHQQVHWDMQWYLLAALSILFLIPALAWFPPPPADEQSLKQHPTMQHAPPNARFMRLFTAAYFCTGFGYVVTATFMVAIINQLPGLSKVGGWMFLLSGIFAIPSCILWDLIARKTGDVNALILASLLEVAGIIAPTLGWGLIGAVLGAVLYGATAIAVVSLTLTMAGRYYPAQPAKMMGKMTIAYGVAQIIAPVLTGWLTDGEGGYEAGLYAAAGVMLFGSYLFYLMRKAQ